MTKPLGEERLLEIIRRPVDLDKAQAHEIISTLIDEVIRLRGVIYDVKQIRVEQHKLDLRLGGLLVGEGGTKD